MSGAEAGGLGLLFPGQGSQFVGMGRDLAEGFPEARQAFEEADEALRLDPPLSAICWEGPESALTATHNAQPAILTHSVAVLRVVRSAVDRLGGVVAAAGHSLGEFSAHVAAGTLDFADALRLVRLRGEAMQAAGAARPGGMLAILGMADDDVEHLCAELTGEGGVVAPANFNTDGQVVVSGDRDALEGAVARFEAAGARKVVPLNVSGAFHSPLMEPAQRSLEQALSAVELEDPSVPVVSNVTAEAVMTAREARSLMVRQLTSPVRWRASVQRMSELRATGFVELGPGSVLTGLNKRNARGVPTQALGNAKSVSEWMERVQ